MTANPTTGNWAGSEQYQPLYNSCLRKRILAQCCHLDTLQNNTSSGRAGQRSAKQWPPCWLRAARRCDGLNTEAVVGQYVTQFALGEGATLRANPTCDLAHQTTLIFDVLYSTLCLLESMLTFEAASPILGVLYRRQWTPSVETASFRPSFRDRIGH